MGGGGREVKSEMTTGKGVYKTLALFCFHICYFVPILLYCTIFSPLLPFLFFQDGFR